MKLPYDLKIGMYSRKIKTQVHTKPEHQCSQKFYLQYPQTGEKNKQLDTSGNYSLATTLKSGVLERVPASDILVKQEVEKTRFQSLGF